MGQALYRKYRSKKLSEIVGQEHITTTLARAIKTGKISHAYLFTGPRGVGKTSIARILAHEVNGLPYTDESVHLDIIEIDAASNRRIDEIRDLRDKVHIAPTSARYKVYIIDEVHMLTKEAFNALLKTLEEPPAHVIFILATTEAHKLPDTIVSRTQRFTFKAISQSKAVAHLRELAKKEGMQVDDGALELLAEHGGGSFRDAIGLLDQIGNSSDKITRADVESMIGIAPHAAIEGLLQSVAESPKAIIVSLSSFIDRGISPAQAAKQLSGVIRNQLLSNELSLPPVIATTLLAGLLRVPASPDPLAALELVLFEACHSITQSHHTPVIPVNAAPVIETTPKKPTPSLSTKPNPSVITKSSSPEPVTTTLETEQPADQMLEAAPMEPIVFSEDISLWWPQLQDAIKKHNNTLYGILRMAHPSFENDILTMSFAFGFHAKKVTAPETAVKLQDEIKILTGKDVTIKALHNKELKDTKPPILTPQTVSHPNVMPKNESVHAQDLGAITSIFGGGEVLET